MKDKLTAEHKTESTLQMGSLHSCLQHLTTRSFYMLDCEVEFRMPRKEEKSEAE